MIGQLVCSAHGGKSPQARTAAQRRLAEDAARAAVEKYGIPVRTTVAQALRDELERSAGIVAFLVAKVQELPEADLTWGREKAVIKPASVTGQQPTIESHLAARPHVYVVMLAQERKHLAAVAAEMARLGIEARLARAAEAAGGQIVAVLEAYAAALGHDPRDLAVQAAGARALTLVTGDG